MRGARSPDPGCAALLFDREPRLTADPAAAATVRELWRDVPGLQRDVPACVADTRTQLILSHECGRMRAMLRGRSNVHTRHEDMCSAPPYHYLTVSPLV